MRGRTVILVSHHVQLCAPGAGYIVALENGRVLYKGDRDGFQTSGMMQSLAHSGAVESTGKEEAKAVVRETKEELLLGESDDGSGSGTPNTEIPLENDSIGGVTTVDESPTNKKKGPRKLVEEEARAVGRVGRTVWETYFKACGGASYWFIFAIAFVLAAMSPIAENGWLRYAHSLVVVPEY
jgi:ABC-type multidrug transport system ATPase subunit